MISSTYARPTDGRTVHRRPARDGATDADVLAGLQRGGPVLIEGGTVLTQDPGLGDLAGGDVLIRDGRVAAVGTGLRAGAPDAVVVDARDTIVLPGFVDSHVHAWEGQLRGIAPTVDFGGYLGITAFGAGPRYTPHDTYLGTLVTALVALDAGITTIVDNAHNCRSYDHAAAGVEALTDSGIRGVHAWGRPFGAEPGDWQAEVTRLRDRYFGAGAGAEGRVTFRMFDVVPSADMWDYARAEGIWMSHEMGTHVPDVGDVLDTLAGKGLLTARHAFNHCYDLPDRTWRSIRDAGAAVNLCPRSDAAFGLGSSVPPVDTVRRLGIVPGLSGDNEISYGLSMFTDMQVLLNGHRGRAFAAAHAGAEVPADLSPAEVLSWATVGGAANAGLSDRVGSLTPGKEADVVLLRTTDVNTDAIDPVGTVTGFAHAGNVDTVLVGGEVRKFRGRAVGPDADRVRTLVAASREALTT